jgi:hypothetical protein
MEKLTLTPNVPQQIALKFPDGKLVEGRFGDQMMYSLANNQVMYLDTDVAAKINALELRKNEPFWICKRWTGKKGDQITLSSIGTASWGELPAPPHQFQPEAAKPGKP